MSQMASRGLQLAPLALLLLNDQDCKGWCHSGHAHGTSCSPCVNIVLTATACYGGFDEGLWRADFA